MRHYLALTLSLAFAISACDSKSESSGGGGTANPPPAPTSGSPSTPQAPSPSAPAGPTGSISGVVKLDGVLTPDKGPGGILGIPACAAVWKNKVPESDTLVMGEGQTMANVLVYVKTGLPNRKYDAPKDGVVFDQIGCIYTPHVLAVQANQPVTFRNGDTGIMHNVNGAPKLNESFNKGQINKGDQNTFQFPIEEIAISVNCNVHPWMSAYLHVLPHPYFKLTGKDGAYKIEGLPAGEYELRAWHEKFKDKPLIAKVTVAAGGTATQDFNFKGAEKK
ncbi:MAG TPA: hypothetical protein VJS20_07720 [Gemmatimonadales bacterium]|nr:hypothetical protein [Gemmatimonadales bacterium]